MTEPNRQLVEEYMNAWAGADVAKLERIIDPNYKFNNPPPGLTPDKKGAIQMSMMYRKAFPDMKMRYVNWVSEGNNTAVRFLASGTHKGEFMGFPASNKRTEVGGLAFVTIKNGKIVEDVTEVDTLSMLQQIGAIPQELTSSPRKSSSQLIE